MMENEFYASQTFAGMTKEKGQEYTWTYESSEKHGTTVLHWFSSLGDGASQLIGVAVADQNNCWLGSAYSNYNNATEKQCVVRDLYSARLLMDALADVERAFFQNNCGFWNLIKVYFSFISNPKEKNLEFLRTICLCELRYAASTYENA